MIEFQNCKALVNGTGIIADSASLSTENNLSPLYVIGKKGIINNSPKGSIKNSFRFSYYPQLNSEPNVLISNLLKNFVNSGGNYSGVTLSICNITGYNCYLDSFSIKAAPNDLVRASASFTSFIPLSGSVNTGFNDIVIDSLAYGWATYVASGASYLTVPTYDFEYSFEANWSPFYVLGNKYPAQIDLLSCSEQIKLQRDAFYQSSFSGNDPCSQFMSCSLDGTDIEIANLSFVCEAEGFGGTPSGQSITFTITGGKLTNSNLDAKVDDIVRVDSVITKYY